MKASLILISILSATAAIGAAVQLEHASAVSVYLEAPSDPLPTGAAPPADNSTLEGENSEFSDEGEMSLAAAPTRNFAHTCRNYGIVSLTHFPRLFRAECLNAAGTQWSRSDLSLSRCLVNICGGLREGDNGNYDLSCDARSCRTSGSRITCNCRDCGGNWVSTTYDLNNVMANNNGVLQCYGHRGF